MKIYIMTDIEGISGISSSSYVSASKNRPDLIAEGRVLMAGDINACVEDVMQMRKEVLTLAGDYRGNSQTLVL